MPEILNNIVFILVAGMSLSRSKEDQLLGRSDQEHCDLKPHPVCYAAWTSGWHLVTMYFYTTASLLLVMYLHPIRILSDIAIHRILNQMSLATRHS